MRPVKKQEGVNEKHLTAEDTRKSHEQNIS